MEAKEAIVCADDDAIILMSLKRELVRHFKDRFVIETAPGAKEALDSIDGLYDRGIRVILIMTDWLMPGMKGDKLVVTVKERHPDVKCILISGQVDKKAIVDAGLEGLVDAFVPKPWRSEQLMESVRKCVG